MVFDNQIAGFEAMLAAYPTPGSIPAEISEDVARALIKKYFADVPDPLPRWADVKALLDAKKKECEIDHYTFEEKRSFDPHVLAETILTRKMTRQEEQEFLQSVWDEKSACRSVYRGDMRSFREDVDREVRERTTPDDGDKQPFPEVEKIVPHAAPRAWPQGEAGYSLVRLRDSVLAVKKHFPSGPPLVAELRWSTRPNPRLWGFCRYSNKSVTINCVLDSPDIPYFVLEYLMFHELLHADMPSASHNRDFCARERAYAPSAEALEDAVKRGIQPGPKAGTQFWYVSADRFLGTFDRYYLHKKPGTTMEVG